MESHNQTNSPNQLEPQPNSHSHQTTNPPNTDKPIHCQRLKPRFKKNWVYWRCMTSSDITYINKYKPKMIHRVSLNTLCLENIGASGLRKLRKALADSKSASYVHLASSDINAKQIVYLLDSTNHWKHLIFSPLQNPERFSMEVIKAFPRLDRCNNLRKFAFPFLSNEQHLNGKMVYRLYRHLKRLNKLQSLGFDLPQYNNATILDYKPPRSLQYLALGFKNKNLFHNQQLSAFISSLKQCNLSSLSLRFSKDFLFEPLDAEIWTSFFHNPPSSLKSLKLNLVFNATQQLEGIQAFLESFKHLKSVTILNLNFDLLSVPNLILTFLDAFFSTLFASLQCLTQLETLELKFLSFPKIKDKEIKYFTSMVQSLENLKTLIINLPSLLSPDESLISIGHSLKQLKTLTILTFVFATPSETNNFSHQSLQTFSKSIAHLHLASTNLTFGYPEDDSDKVIFDFSGIKFSWGKLFGLSKNTELPSLTPFFSDLSQFTRLSDFRLGLSGFRISSQEFHYLSIALKQLKNLSSLYLELPQFNSKNNFEGLRNLFSCFEEMPKLLSLTLFFEGNVTNQEVELLSSSLVDCQSLIKLALHFQKASQLKDESLYFLLGALRTLLKLKDLSLLFQKQDPIHQLMNPKQEVFGEQAITHFLQGLSVLKNLLAFDFVFSVFSLIRYNRAPLPLNLKSYENLRNLTHFIVDDFCYI